MIIKWITLFVNKGKHEGRITGLPIARGGTKLNHLYFVDDSLLFCRASILEWANV